MKFWRRVKGASRMTSLYQFLRGWLATAATWLDRGLRRQLREADREAD